MEHNTADAATVTAFTVTLTHHDLDGPLVIDLLASTPEMAATRARLAGVHKYRHAELLDAAAAVAPITCAWFANCQRQATGWTPHPILREVATCDRCAAFARPDADPAANPARTRPASENA